MLQPKSTANTTHNNKKKIQETSKTITNTVSEIWIDVNNKRVLCIEILKGLIRIESNLNY